MTIARTPPMRVSLPAPPSSVSLPPRPERTLSPLLPVMTLSPAFPVPSVLFPASSYDFLGIYMLNSDAQ
jgi:hypothetical protein